MKESRYTLPRRCGSDAASLQCESEESNKSHGEASERAHDAQAACRARRRLDTAGVAVADTRWVCGLHCSALRTGAADCCGGRRVRGGGTASWRCRSRSDGRWRRSRCSCGTCRVGHWDAIGSLATTWLSDGHGSRRGLAAHTAHLRRDGEPLWDIARTWCPSGGCLGTALCYCIRSGHKASWAERLVHCSVNSGVAGCAACHTLGTVCSGHTLLCNR